LISAVFQIPETNSVVGRNVLTDFVSFAKRKQSQATQIHSSVRMKCFDGFLEWRRRRLLYFEDLRTRKKKV
jgi:hypothetical protein